MANGDVIKANKAVISACGVFNTYKKLLLPKAPGLPPSVEAHLSRCREKMDRIGHVRTKKRGRIVCRGRHLSLTRNHHINIRVFSFL